MTLKIKPVTLKTFAEFLKKTDGNRVGTAARSNDCPLANYYRTVYNLPEENISVSIKTTISDPKTGEVWECDLNKWQQRFIHKIDRRGYGSEYTGDEAYEVLRSVSKGELK